MDKLIERANRRTTVGAAAFLISGSYLASRLLGLFRDRLLASHFGVGPLVDAYTAAFRLPELLFTLLVSGAFAVAFIPVFAESWKEGHRDEAWELSSSILNILIVGTIIAAIIMFIFAGPLTTLVAPGFDPARHELTVKLTRIMLLTPFLFAISSVFGSVQQAMGRFIFFSLASVLYNVGIIIGIVFLSPTNSIYGVAYGVVIGAGAQAVLQAVGLWGLGYRWRPIFHLGKNVRRVLGLMLPRSIDQGIDQINYTIQTIIGSSLATGSLTTYYYANNLKNVPLVVLGSAIATAAFPKLARDAASGDKQKLIEGFVINARLILFLIIPAATIAVLMRGYIVRLLFGFGSPQTATTLGWFAGVIVFQSLFFLVARVYYALQDTKTPLYVSIAAIGLNVFLSILLAKGHGVAGLAMAQSVTAALETIILLGILHFRLTNIGMNEIAKGVMPMLLANTIMASVLYIMVAAVLPLYATDRGFYVVGSKFGVIAITALLAYIIPSYLLELREARTFVAKLKPQLRQPTSLS